jgi:hypothetical protein
MGSIKLVGDPVEEAIDEFYRLVRTSEVGEISYNGWSLNITVYPPPPNEYHEKYEIQLNEHPYRFHVNACRAIASMSDGVWALGDNLVEQIKRCTEYLRKHGYTFEEFGPLGTRIELPNDPVSNI